MYLKTQGLVLRVTAYNDTDALLTLLTKQHGKITVKARGLRRKNSPLIAPCQLLALGEYILFEYRGMYVINEAYSIELFQQLRKDLSKLSLGTYFAQVADIISQEDIPTPELLSLVLNCLYALSKLDITEKAIKAVFELRCACLAGYEPDLHGCHHCAEPFADRFDISGGRLECAKCSSWDSAGIRMPVVPGALEAMRYICSCEPRNLFQFRIGEETQEQLGNISESYLVAQLEQGFSTLDFYKSLQ